MDSELFTDDLENTINEINGYFQNMSIFDFLEKVVMNEGYIVVDKHARIVKWGYEKILGIKEEDVIGKYVVDVLDNTRMHIVVKTGQAEIYSPQIINNQKRMGSRYPIIKDGEIIGAIGLLYFKHIDQFIDILKNNKTLNKTIENYKSEISRIYCANYTFSDIITQNEIMLNLKDTALKAAATNATVLIQGDTGTGKEYFAHAIHYASQRKEFPFIRINCAAIPSELLESELFGYEAGAFTGANKNGKIGKLELANGGTFLLDEISSMPMDMQSKLLRVLEEREIERIGGNSRINIDVRIIASTNDDLLDLVKKKKFRLDLFYRLNVFALKIPPLRKRLDDMEVLCNNILNKQVSNGINTKKVSDKAIASMKLYNWPGNVRELRNILERASIESIGNVIDINDLPNYIAERIKSGEVKESKLYNYPQFADGQMKSKIADSEVRAIEEALRMTNGNRTKAAKLLGIHRTALYKKLEKHGIDVKVL